MSYNVLGYGVFGDGETDDTAALQALIGTVPANSALYFPAGHYVVSAPLDCGSKGLRFYGDSQGRALTAYLGGSQLRGDVDGPILKMAYPAEGVSISDMGFVNLRPLGVGLELSGLLVAVDRVSIVAGIGIKAVSQNFTLGIRSLKLLCNQAGCPVGSIGVLLTGHATLQSADIVGFDHGLRACGPGISVSGCRVEVNRIGMVLGMAPAGNAQNYTGTVSACSFEANDVGIYALALAGATVSGMTIQGSTGSPSGQSLRGVHTNLTRAAEFNGISVNGSHSDAAVKIVTPPGTQRWQGIVSNSHPTGKKWDYIPSPLLDMNQCV